MNVSNATSESEIAIAMDWVRGSWLLVSTFLVMNMQLGFAMLEVGSCRQEHRSTVVLKNALDSAVSVMAFWLHSCFIPMSSLEEVGEISKYHLLAFHSAFCATCVTICSGSMAERAHMGAYLCYACVMAGIIYPVISEAVWGTNPKAFLFDEFHDRFAEGYSYHDFAGSGVVHLLGGAAACTGNLMLGRRILKPATGSAQSHSSPQRGPRGDQRDEEMPAVPVVAPAGGWKRRFCDPANDEIEFVPCSYLQALGTFTLWFGWYGFNVGPAWVMAASSSGVIALNTTLAGGAGGLGSSIYAYAFHRRFSVSWICNGILSGLVAITASCDLASPTAALCIGFAASAVVWPLAKKFTDAILLDDPVDAVTVHAAVGLYGVVCVAVASPDGNLCALGPSWQELQRFCSPEYSISKQLAAQVWAALAEILFTLGWCLPMWGLFVVSECTRASESPTLLAASTVLGAAPAHVGSVASVSHAYWRELASRSSVLRRLLRSTGWTPQGGFDSLGGAQPLNASALRADLRVSLERIETGLEEEVTDCRLVRCLVWLARPLSRFAVFRLRVPPVSELSGAGASDVSSGGLAQVIAAAVSDSRDDQRQRSIQHLREEIQELAATVDWQRAELTGLSRTHRQRGLPAQLFGAIDKNGMDLGDQGDRIAEQSVFSVSETSSSITGSPMSSPRYRTRARASRTNQRPDQAVLSLAAELIMAMQSQQQQQPTQQRFHSVQSRRAREDHPSQCHMYTSVSDASTSDDFHLSHPTGVQGPMEKVPETRTVLHC